MTVYHLGQTRYAHLLTGEGAKLFGGRWNKIGQPCIYTSETRSLCVLEYAANVTIEDVANELSFTAYDIPDDSWTSFTAKQLPQDWMEMQASNISREWGTQHLQNHLALRLPSVIIPLEYNIILNPLHADFKKVKIKIIEPYSFDKRIKK